MYMHVCVYTYTCIHARTHAYIIHITYGLTKIFLAERLVMHTYFSSKSDSRN